MPENIAISIIIPLYRAEKFIRECLESIREQIFTQTYEVIVVDDCSDDRSVAIVQEKMREFSHICLLRHDTNRGVSAARNTGLDAVRGDYFMFLDSDDTLTQYSLETMWLEACESGADVVKGNNLVVSAQSVKPANYNVKRKKCYLGRDAFTQLLLHGQIRGHSWGKLFRSTTCGSPRFDESLAMTEDLMYCAEILVQIERLVLIPDNVYSYRSTVGGITDRKYETGAYLQWLETLDKLDQMSSSSTEKRACFALKLRSLLQMLRECRCLKGQLRTNVVHQIRCKKDSWSLSFSNVVFRLPFQVQSWFRYLKFKTTLDHVRS